MKVGITTANAISHGLADRLVSGTAWSVAALSDPDLSLRDIDLDLIRLLIKLHEQVAFAHTIVVVHQHAHDVTGHSRGDKGDVAIHVGVVSGHCPEGCDHSGDRFVQGQYDEHGASGPHPPWPPLRLLPCWGLRDWRIGIRRAYGWRQFMGGIASGLC
jgi:hypothetical protein